VRGNRNIHEITLLNQKLIQGRFIVTDILLIVILVLLVVAVALLFILFRKAAQSGASVLVPRLDAFEKAQERTERAVREEVTLSRDEQGKASREQRQELTEAFKTFGDSVVLRMMDVSNIQKGQLDVFSGQLASFAKSSGERLDGVRAESATGAKQLREEVVATLNGISETITKIMGGLATAQQAQFEVFGNQLTSFAQTSGEKLDGARVESATGAKQLREEVVTTLNSISETMVKTMKDLSVAEKAQLDAFSGKITFLTQTSGEKLDGIRTEFTNGAKQLREEVIAALKGITEATTNTMGELANLQKVQLEAMSTAIVKLSESNEKKLEEIRGTVEAKLQSIQTDNAKQLEQMRQTVDEKLQGTLEKRLGESFKQVSERLELVHKGLGEMQSLATGVGDLKKVLTNVKTRGTWGEVQLGVLLEQVLNPDQFAINVSTKDGGERVEYAVRLPGQGLEKDETVWLPIDAKFPVEDYQRLVEAQERADIEGVEAAGKQLEIRVKACAGDISRKYLNPPKTTDFAILFLPIEGLFAEVIRRTGLTEVIQRECRVVIAGPTTLWSILSSFRWVSVRLQFRSVPVRCGTSLQQLKLSGRSMERFWTQCKRNCIRHQRQLTRPK
jgi:DNA recombination protein RmuC